jgi:co-chaperonin GroES (HSP10)
MSTNLRAIGNSILFTFLDETSGKAGRFTERVKSNIIVPILNSTQTNTHRWGKVVAVGPDVYDVSPGEFVLIQSLQWTLNAEFNGSKIWKTNDEQILAVTHDENDTFSTF